MGIHHCRAMQKDYDTYGLSSFKFKRILVGAGKDKATLKALEGRIIRLLPPEKKYNVYDDASSRRGAKNPFYGKKHTLEALVLPRAEGAKATRELQSFAKKGKPSPFKGCTQSEEHKLKRSLQNTGTSSEQRKKPCVAYGDTCAEGASVVDGVYYASLKEASDLIPLSRNKLLALKALVSP